MRSGIEVFGHRDPTRHVGTQFSLRALAATEIGGILDQASTSPSGGLHCAPYTHRARAFPDGTGSNQPDPCNTEADIDRLTGAPKILS